jgi:aminoglycoside 6'-N-acetyltransferase I
MKVRPYGSSDREQLVRMSVALFPEPAENVVTPDALAFRARRHADVFVAERPDGTLSGFVEVGTRPYADGCDSSPVGYVEAWYVDPDVRRQGYGRALLAAAEDWARARGCTEIASDTQITNTVSYAAHRRAGYDEVDRIVQFRKAL